MKVPFSNRTCLISGPSGSDLMKHTRSGELEQAETNGLRAKYGDRQRSTDTSLGCHCLRHCFVAGFISACSLASQAQHFEQAFKYRWPSTFGRFSSMQEVSVKRPQELSGSIPLVSNSFNLFQLHLVWRCSISIRWPYNIHMHMQKHIHIPTHIHIQCVLMQM